MQVDLPDVFFLLTIQLAYANISVYQLASTN